MKKYDDDTLLTIMEEVRGEIRRINQAAGETVFNPTVTQLVDRVITEEKSTS